jgi:adenylate kinase family enzyme
MSTTKTDFFLITGIPGTGKTWYGDRFATEFGFVHHDLEEEQTRNRFERDPQQFIADLLALNKNAVVTWGFVPDQMQTSLVLQFREAGFKLIWFDGNRPAALREFRKRGTVPEGLFHIQMQRIESSQVIEKINPAVIDSFDASGQFKSPAELLEEVRNV